MQVIIMYSQTPGVRVPIPITQVCSYNDRSMQSSFVISYKIIKAAIKPNGDSD